MQQLTLRHPVILAKLGLQDKSGQKTDSEKSGAPKFIVLGSQGLPDKNSSLTVSNETGVPQTTPDSPENWVHIPAENLSPIELFAVSNLEYNCRSYQNPNKNTEFLMYLRIHLLIVRSSSPRWWGQRGCHPLTKVSYSFSNLKNVS